MTSTILTTREGVKVTIEVDRIYNPQSVHPARHNVMVRSVDGKAFESATYTSELDSAQLVEIVADLVRFAVREASVQLGAADRAATTLAESIERRAKPPRSATLLPVVVERREALRAAAAEWVRTSHNVRAAAAAGELVTPEDRLTTDLADAANALESTAFEFTDAFRAARAALPTPLRGSTPAVVVGNVTTADGLLQPELVAPVLDEHVYIAPPSEGDDGIRPDRCAHVHPDGTRCDYPRSAHAVAPPQQPTQEAGTAAPAVAWSPSTGGAPWRP